MAVRIPNLGPRTRKVVRYGGFALVGLITFVFAVQLTFPFGRVKDKVVELLSEKYDVTIGDVERGILPGRMYFKAVSLRTRPTSVDETPTTFYIEQLEVNLGLFALLRGTASVKLDAKIGPGHIKGTVALSKDGTEVDVVGEDLPSASLPMREALGLPMTGKIRFAFALDLPTEKSKSGKAGPNWTKAQGGLELACPTGCTIGDGKSKLRAKLKNRAQQAFAEGGIDFGKVNVDTLFAKVEIKNGKVNVTRFDVKSPDGELHVDVDMTLNQDLQSSVVTGCLRFKGSHRRTGRPRQPVPHQARRPAARGPPRRRGLRQRRSAQHGRPQRRRQPAAEPHRHPRLPDDAPTDPAAADQPAGQRAAAPAAGAAADRHAAVSDGARPHGRRHPRGAAPAPRPQRRHPQPRPDPGSHPRYAGERPGPGSPGPAGLRGARVGVVAQSAPRDTISSLEPAR
jgi:type II secretion system protein N